MLRKRPVPLALQNLHERLLDATIQHRRNAKLPHPCAKASTVRLRDFHPFHWLRFIDGWIWTLRSDARSSNAHASDPVLVHRLAPLLHASFRPRLATTPLRFANPSPPSGWVKDFHLQTAEHARHTSDTPREAGGLMGWTASKAVGLWV